MYENVKIERIDDENLVFLSASGNETRKGLAEISRISADDEPDFTVAEQAFDTGNAADSIEGYRKAVRGSSHDWVRKRAALRLIAAGNQASDFGAAVAGFAYLAVTDPDAALQAKPDEFVGHLTSEVRKKKIDYIIAVEKSKGKISDRPASYSKATVAFTSKIR